MEVFREFFDFFPTLFLNFRNTIDIDYEADWTNDAGEQERTPANPDHSDTEAGFRNRDGECSADKPGAEDNCSDFVRISGANALLVIFAKDEMPENNQNISQNDESRSDVGGRGRESIDWVHEVVIGG